MKYHKNVRFVNFIKVYQQIFVQFTLEFFKGSMILRSTHVCKVCWVITFETWKTPKPIHLQLGITKMRMLLPRKHSESRHQLAY